MDHGRSLSGVFYAGRICHGGDRIYKSKNSGNILMKNMMDFVLGSIFFFIIGFALMFGGSNAFIGTAGFFIRNRWQMQMACSTDCRSVYS